MSAYANLNIFWYNDAWHIRVVPGKNLFHSTMIHEVVNRGDIFAVNMKTSRLTIVPGNARVEHAVMPITMEQPS